MHPLLPVLIVLTILGVLLTVFVWIPLGSPEVFQGQVSSISVSHSKFGNSLNTTVVLSGRKVFVRAFSIRGCAVGDQIAVRGQRHLWGRRFYLDAAPCRADASPGLVRVID